MSGIVKCHVCSRSFTDGITQQDGNKCPECGCYYHDNKAKANDKSDSYPIHDPKTGEYMGWNFDYPKRLEHKKHEEIMTEEKTSVEKHEEERQRYQKHEKVEKMAWEVTLQTIVPTSPKEYTCVPCKVAWGMAEQFYEYAKEKGEKQDA